jgi:hypothetical protein
MNRMTLEYSCLKVSEGGGISRKEAIKELTRLGLEVKPCHSPYVGCYGIRVTGSGQQQERAEQFLFP